MDAINRLSEEEPKWEMDDLIVRGDAIDAMTDENIIRNLDSVHDCALNRIKRSMMRILAGLPSAEPETDDYCDTCKEYDLVKHSCPIFNRVIRSALESIKVQKKGKWIDRGYLQIGFHCSECGGYVMSGKENYCPWCGADMRGEEDE